MPLLFQACKPSGSTTGPKMQRARVCCLNSKRLDVPLDPMSTPACRGCPQCAFIKPSGERCGNRTCWADMCHVHLPKVYGVRMSTCRFGRNLVATRKFKPGEIIAPMGGKPMSDNNDWLPGNTYTNPYAYPLLSPKRYSLHKRRHDVHHQRFIPSGGIRNPTYRLSLVPRPDRTATFWRVAVVAPKREGRTRLYLVQEPDWPVFLDELSKKIVTPAVKKELANNLNKLNLTNLNIPRRLTPTNSDAAMFVSSWWDLSQFGAYMECSTNNFKSVVMDASCHRQAGSYANDPADIRFRPTRDGTTVGEILSENIQKVNAYISAVAPYPLQNQPSGWLIAAKPIAEKEEVFVEYGRPYWTGQHVPSKTYPVQSGVSLLAKRVKPPSTRCSLRIH